jgi:sugar-specific transcriptional regulator TrmB
MNEDRQLLSFLDSTPDSVLYEYMLPFDKIKLQLSKFGLTPNEAKVFIYLGKYGSKTAIEISKGLKIARTETYRVVSTLQNMGIVSSAFDHPTRFSALPIEDAINALIESEIENVKTLQTQKDSIIGLWQEIPVFSREDETAGEKFQMIKGQNAIISKINEMFSDAKESLLVLGPEKFFVKLYYSESLDLLRGCRAEIRFLTSCTKKSMYVFKELPRKSIRKISFDVENTLCFVVKDHSELLSFVKSDFSHPQETVAIRTDCSSLIYTMKLLFNQIWSSAETSLGDSDSSGLRRHPDDILLLR